MCVVSDDDAPGVLQIAGSTPDHPESRIAFTMMTSHQRSGPRMGRPGRESKPPHSCSHDEAAIDAQGAAEDRSRRAPFRLASWPQSWCGSRKAKGPSGPFDAFGSPAIASIDGVLERRVGGTVRHGCGSRRFIAYPHDDQFRGRCRLPGLPALPGAALRPTMDSAAGVLSSNGGRGSWCARWWRQRSGC